MLPPPYNCSAVFERYPFDFINDEARTDAETFLCTAAGINVGNCPVVSLSLQSGSLGMSLNEYVNTTCIIQNLESFRTTLRVSHGILSKMGYHTRPGAYEQRSPGAYEWHCRS